MVRFLLLAILLLIALRVLWRLLGGVFEGLGYHRPGGSSPPSVGLVRDPVCGTFILPDRAVTLLDGRSRLYFFSDACRDRYRARTA